uniref:DNA polymerase theta n=1 Tax=Glossina brevipalpis TaxID=37001 RepID=A0A1A9W5U6_9MUSC
MAFFESFELGNSALIKLESQEKHALDDKLAAEPLEVISESPTDSRKTTKLNSFSNLSRIRSIARGKTQAPVNNSIENRKFRRSKSDSTLPKTNAPDNGLRLDNLSDVFRNDFTFSKIPTPAASTIPDKIVNKEVSDIRVSQLEAIFHKYDEKEKEEWVNSLEKPIFSEDLSDLLKTEESDDHSFLYSQSTKQQESKESEEILHDVSNFICLPTDNEGQRQEFLENELQESQKFLERSGLIKQKTMEVNISLTSMSPGQLKFTQSSQSPLQKSISLNFNANSITKPEFKCCETKVLEHNLEDLKSINAWNLPLSVLKEYERKGVKKMFDWQVECLSNPKVLFEYCNLVYSAPTSAGKTLISEILLLKTVLERNRKALMILPFISVVREKMFYLQDLFTAAGYRVEGFFGGYTPPGGFESIHVAICTIEKANSIVNRLMEQGKLDEIGTVIVDEIHLISDPGRGYILELLLAKILYMSRKYGLQIQVITMSATLANIELLKKWLDAELYITNFRPVALKQMIKVANKIYDCNMQLLRTVAEPTVNIADPFPSLESDPDHVAQLCIETLVESCSVIVFCSSKDWCENLALKLAAAIHTLGKLNNEWGERVKTQLKREAIDEMKQQLRDIPTGLDNILEKTITYGCAFHHAGLTIEERDIIETSFKAGTLKIIVATSTLSSGVNLPARRVLIRSPLFAGKQMSSLTYRQMIGRAGRTGKDTLGESILICTDSNARIGRDLITADLKPLSSCLELDSSTHLKRALLEVISSGVATSKMDIDNFVKCTLLSVEKELHYQEKENDNDYRSNGREYINDALKFLEEYEFIRLSQKSEETQEEFYVATRLGMACLSASMPPTDGLILFAELQKCRRCFVLESELHAVYLVTPYSVCYQLQDLDWLFFLDLWENLTSAMKKVGELIGVKESFLVRAMRGQNKLDYKLMQIHKRFYTALALQELVYETPINKVAAKYKCSRGMLQSLQQMASTFAGIVTSFCNSLQWDTLASIVSQFKERLFFGIHRDLMDLMRLPDLNQKRARALFKAGITNLIELANSEILEVEKILYNALSFDSKKQYDNENALETAQRNEARNFYITGKKGVTVAEAADLLIKGARQFLQYEIGVKKINWSQTPEPPVNAEEENLKSTSDLKYMKLDTFNRETNMSMKENIHTREHFLEKQEQEKSENLSHLESNKNNCVNQTNGHLTENLSRPITITPKEKSINENKSEETLEKSKNLITIQSTEELKRKSIQQPEEYKEVTPTKQQKTNQVNGNVVLDSEEQPSTSKKAQRLLKARQLSAMKKLEWAQKQQLQDEKEQQKQKKSSENENFKTLITKKATMPRRSPRNQKTNSASTYDGIVDEKRSSCSHQRTENLKGTVTGFEKIKKRISKSATSTNSNDSTDDNKDEIPNSQQQFENDMNTKAIRSVHTSRFLRSYRHSQRTQSPKLSNKNVSKLPNDNKELYCFTSSFEYSDVSMENSLLKNPIQLNASHILSCVEYENEGSSFKSLEIFDVCNNQQFFKMVFKELLASKRLAMCLGINQRNVKRKPLIGGNLLINQMSAAEQQEKEDRSNYEFQIDDANYLDGIAFCLSQNNIFYVNMQSEGTCKDLTQEIKCKYLRTLLQSIDCTFLVYEAKEQIKILKEILQSEILINLEDPKVSNWLLQPDKIYNLNHLVQQFAPECNGLVNLCGSARGYSSYGLDSSSAILAKIRSSVEACVTFHVLKGQIENMQRIGKGELYKFFKELEMPLQMSLANMELDGFPTNSDALQKLFQNLVETMKRLEMKIYELHGTRFNLGSSAAVARIVGLHRKSNGRISTSKQILEKIESPISQMILNYRKLNAILTKNIQPLMKCVKDNRIRGQSITFTSTGRISMVEPNLQNVAKDFEVDLSNEKILISCRQIFYPSDITRCLLSSDFCQLEMRILAHLSQDSTLLKIIKSDKDIFTSIAAHWNKISEMDVSEQLRNATKQICYGIVYGMGVRSLAEALKCNEKEASLVSEQFHASYPGIRIYMEKIIKFARNNGYIETITGRRRYLENINNAEISIKNQAERQAVNSTIQGSAADIAKNAILRMEKNIIKYQQKLGLDKGAVRLVLHLHDELMFEVPEDKVKKIAKVLRLTMENCVKLNVPLKVKLKTGKSWGQLKEMSL